MISAYPYVNERFTVGWFNRSNDRDNSQATSDRRTSKNGSMLIVHEPMDSELIADAVIKLARFRVWLDGGRTNIRLCLGPAQTELTAVKALVELKALSDEGLELETPHAVDTDLQPTHVLFPFRAKPEPCTLSRS